MMQLLVVDGDCFTAAGLREFLASVPDFEVGECVNSDQEALVLMHPPDVVVVGHPLPDMPVAQFMGEMAERSRPTRSLVMGVSEDLEETLILLRAGAHGYFLRGDTRENMAAAIRAVARREPWFSHKIAAQFFARLNAKEEEEGKLTARQVEILQLVEKGMSNKAIALILHRKLRTVKSHLEHIFKELGVSNRTEACRVAREKGWLKQTRGT